MRFLPVNIAVVMIWRKFYQCPHLPFPIVIELPALPVVAGKSVAMHLPVQPEVFAGKNHRETRSRNVKRF